MKKWLMPVLLGMAWEYSNYHSNRIYIALQGGAQRGLWRILNGGCACSCAITSENPNRIGGGGFCLRQQAQLFPDAIT